MQCTTFESNSVISDIRSHKTNSRLSSLSFENTLNIPKAHRPNDISIHMIKICNSALVKPLSLIFQNYCLKILLTFQKHMVLIIYHSALVKPLSLIPHDCLNCSIFPDIWKRSNICPVHTHKKNSNY